jgi:phage N-6-adenine-methyltransferase
MTASRMDLYRSTKRHDWETPPHVFEALDAEFRFTLDVAASDENAKCEAYFAERTDGLSQDWGNNVCWMNPPYGTQIKHWVAKARREAENGATVVCLIPARTDTRWWHDHIQDRAEVRFIKGRLRFSGATINAPFPSCIVIFRPSPPNP